MEGLKISHDQKDPGKGQDGGGGERERVKSKELGRGGIGVGLGEGEKEEKEGMRMSLDRKLMKGEEIELDKRESWREDMSISHKRAINILKEKTDRLRA